MITKLLQIAQGKANIKSAISEYLNGEKFIEYGTVISNVIETLKELAQPLEPVIQNKLQLCTSTEDLVSGEKFIIVCDSYVADKTPLPHTCILNCGTSVASTSYELSNQILNVSDITTLNSQLIASNAIILLKAPVNQTDKYLMMDINGYFIGLSTSTAALKVGPIGYFNLITFNGDNVVITSDNGLTLRHYHATETNASDDAFKFYPNATTGNPIKLYKLI